ncbi:hypothetical protein [Chrysiogenes arsenatis]|uniref:hypothetical protein n=1 Tax=Chrysiogenes arsenatis TaxID=309797 RepID=UPI0003FB990B|nr:hypothetical protein [Chrysiogenes arsenatis]
MAMLRLMGNGPHHDVMVAGALVTVGEVTIDAAALQRDESVTVDVFVSPTGGFMLDGPGAFAVNVAIPPRRYHEEAAMDEFGEGDADGDGELMGSGTVVREPLPLDVDTVVVTLWPK